MSEHEPADGEKREIFSAESGSFVVAGEGLMLHNHGPSRDGIRVSDSRGWYAAADITDGMIETTAASGMKSEGEHLTLDTAEILVRRLNADGATWERPKLLPPSDGDDCEALDARGRGYPPLRIQVTRPELPEGFWAGITAGSSVPPGPVANAARSLWNAIEGKRPAQYNDVVLAINAIRTPWFALSSIVEAFQKQYGEVAAREGWAAIWVVSADGTFTKRLDRVVGA